MDEALRARWPEYRADLNRALPGAFEQAMHFLQIQDPERMAEALAGFLVRHPFERSL